MSSFDKKFTELTGRELNKDESVMIYELFNKMGIDPNNTNDPVIVMAVILGLQMRLLDEAKHTNKEAIIQIQGLINDAEKRLTAILNDNKLHMVRLQKTIEKELDALAEKKVEQALAKALSKNEKMLTSISKEYFSATFDKLARKSYSLGKKNAEGFFGLERIAVRLGWVILIAGSTLLIQDKWDIIGFIPQIFK